MSHLRKVFFSHKGTKTQRITNFKQLIIITLWTFETSRLCDICLFLTFRSELNQTELFCNKSDG